LARPPPLPALGSAASVPSTSFLDSMILAQEQRAQALLASQLAGLGPNAACADSLLRALMMQQRRLEQHRLEQQILASFPASPANVFGLGMGLGMNTVLSRGDLGLLSPSSLAQQSLMLGQSGGSIATLQAEHDDALNSQTGRSKGRTGAFPQKLHHMLADLEKEESDKEIASFLPHGRAFAIHKPKEFLEKIMLKYFRMSRFSSFQRQLNLYEFQRIGEGPDKGAYYHELFIQSRPMLCRSIRRNKIKGAAANPNQMPLGPGVGLNALLHPTTPTVASNSAAAGYLGNLSERRA
jgi:hypothetical protein